MYQSLVQPVFRSIIDFFVKRKFTGLLATMLVLNLIRMATVDDFEDRFVLDILGAALLLAATLSLCIEKRSRTIALFLGIPSIILSLARNLFTGPTEHIILIAGRGVSFVFVAFLIAVILRTLMTQSEVSRDSIAGAFCGYVLIGVMFAEAYSLLEDAVPNSFQLNAQSTKSFNDPFQRWMMLEYYSFTTLTTLGIGDVLPVSSVARGLTIWEVTCGQFYLAVLVAGLVNLRGARDSTEVDV